MACSGVCLETVANFVHCPNCTGPWGSACKALAASINDRDEFGSGVVFSGLQAQIQNAELCLSQYPRAYCKFIAEHAAHLGGADCTIPLLLQQPQFSDP